MKQRAEAGADVLALVVFLETIEQVQSIDHHSVRDRGAEQFDTDQIIGDIITAVKTARLAGGVATAASV